MTQADGMHAYMLAACWGQAKVLMGQENSASAHGHSTPQTRNTIIKAMCKVKSVIMHMDIYAST